MSILLRQFMIGASFLVVAPFYYSVYHSQTKKTYNYYDYSMVAPIWFGLWNILSYFIAEKFGLTLRQRFMVVAVMSSLTIMFIATYMKSYNFTQEEWYKYYVYIFIKYMFVWNVVIYFIEKNMA